MQDTTHDMIVGVVSGWIAVLLPQITIFILNRTSARFRNFSQNWRATLWTTNYLTSFMVNFSTLFMGFILIAAWYKISGKQVEERDAWVVLIFGIVSPLINFITFIITNPPSIKDSIAVGLVSTSFCIGYLVAISITYSILFELLNRVTGL